MPKLLSDGRRLFSRLALSLRSIDLRSVKRPVLKRPVYTIRGVLATAGVFAGATALAVTAAGGSYALWNDGSQVNGGTISSGTSGMTINGSQSVTIDLTGTALLPGRSVVQATPMQFVNTGVTPLNVTSTGIVFTAASASLQPYLQISLRAAVAATCTVTPEATALPASIAPVHFNVGQTVPMCLEIRLISSAPASVQGSTATFTINLDAAQVRT